MDKVVSKISVFGTMVHFQLAGSQPAGELCKHRMLYARYQTAALPLIPPSPLTHSVFCSCNPGCWPLPEAFWPHRGMRTLPGRTVHPTLHVQVNHEAHDAG